MRKFIIGFIIAIIFLALIIGQCNNTAGYDDTELNSLCSDDVERNEGIILDVKETTTEKSNVEVGETIISYHL